MAAAAQPRPDRRAKAPIKGRSAFPILDNREVAWEGEWPALRTVLDRSAKGRAARFAQEGLLK